MKQILEIEWFKLKNYRAFWGFVILSMVAVPGMLIVTNSILDNSGPMGNFISILNFPYVWQWSTWLAGFLHFLPAILLITMITNEFSYKIHRQHVIDGWSRNSYFFSKIMLIVLTSVFFTAVVFLTALFSGLLYSNDGSVFGGVKYVGLFFIQSLSYQGFAFLLAVLLKRTGIAVVVFFAYTFIIEQIIVGIEKFKYKGFISSYFPIESADGLLSIPFSMSTVAQEPTLNLVICIGIYLFIYYLIGHQKLVKSDLA